MTRLSSYVFLLSLVGFLFGEAKAEPSAAVKAELKQTVMAFVKDATINDKYQFVDQTTMELKKLKFVAFHPVVFERKDGLYALCIDFETDEGEKVLVDYYVAPHTSGYLVLSVIGGQRSILMQIADKFNL